MPAEQLVLNEIGLCRILVNAPVELDLYRDCRGSGSLIMIDRLSNATAGADMITAADQADLALIRARTETLLKVIPERIFMPLWWRIIRTGV